jgi:hypothetical protein
MPRTARKQSAGARYHVTSYKHYRPEHCFQVGYKAPLVAGEE